MPPMGDKAVPVNGRRPHRVTLALICSAARLLAPGRCTELFVGRTQTDYVIYVTHKALKTKQKKRDGWIRARFPPPVPQDEPLSRRTRQPEKRVVSKAFAGATGNHAGRSKPLPFSL